MFVVNGRPVYYRGVNMAPMDILFGRIDDERIERQMRLVRDANVNLLRLWGGGAINRRLFYDLADRYGIMLWQEFPLGCTDHEGNEHYRDVLAAEAQAMVKTLRRHPSIVLWCGGNELFLPHSGMGPTDRLVRMLASICYDLDPERLFIPTTPYPGAFHGPYTFDCFGQGGFGQAVDHVGFCNSAPPGAYNECGIAGPAPASVIRRSAAERTLASPPRRGVAVSQGLRHCRRGGDVAHTGTDRAILRQDRMSGRPLPRRTVPPGHRLAVSAGGNETQVARRARHDALVLQYALDIVRGQLRCGLSRPALARVPCPAHAYAPRNVSARLESFVARPGRRITASVFLCDDGSPIAPGLVTAEMAAASGEKLLHREMVAPGMGYMERAAIGNVEFDVPPDFQDVLCLRLCWLHDGQRQENAAYIGVSADASHSPCFRPLLALWEKDPQTRLEGME